MIDVKGNKKNFYRYISCKRKTREDVGPLLSEAGSLTAKDMEQDEVLNALFASSLLVRLTFRSLRHVRKNRKSGARKACHW